MIVLRVLSQDEILGYGKLHRIRGCSMCSKLHARLYAASREEANDNSDTTLQNACSEPEMGGFEVADDGDNKEEAGPRSIPTH